MCSIALGNYCYVENPSKNELQQYYRSLHKPAPGWRRGGLRSLFFQAVKGLSLAVPPCLTHQCINLKMDSGVLLYKCCGWMEPIYIYSPRGSKSIPACTGKHRMTQLIHLGSIVTAGLGRVWGRGKWFWWMTFRVRPLAIANSLQVPTGLMPPICRSGRNEWKALCEINGPFLFDIYKWIFLVKLNPSICFISRGGELSVLVLRIMHSSSSHTAVN